MVLPPEASRPVTPPASRPVRPVARREAAALDISSYDLRPRWRPGRFLIGAAVAAAAGIALFVLKDRGPSANRTAEPVVVQAPPVISAPVVSAPVVAPAPSPVIEPVDVPPPVRASVVDPPPEAQPVPRPMARLEQAHPRSHDKPHDRSHEKTARVLAHRSQKRLGRPQPAAPAAPGPTRSANSSPIID
jgi:hypothetical protein